MRSCIIVIISFSLKIQFDSNLKKKNPTKFKYGLERQKRDLKRTDLMKKKNVLAFSTDQSGISEKQKSPKETATKEKGFIKEYIAILRVVLERIR